MKLSEFKNTIDEIESRMTERINREATPFVCCDIDNIYRGSSFSVDTMARVHFDHLFNPDIECAYGGFWPSHSEYNLTRLIALRLFEQHVLDSKEYLKWEVIK